MKTNNAYPIFSDMSECEVKEYILNYTHNIFPKTLSQRYRYLPASSKEEIVQDLYIDLWNKRDKYDPNKGSFSTYAFNRGRYIIKRSILDWYKHNDGRVSSVNNMMGEPVHPFDILSSKERSPLEIVEEKDNDKKIGEEIECLTMEEREIIYDRFYRRSKVKNLTHKSNLTDSKVIKTLYRGLNKLSGSLWCSKFR